jgi:uncharacterized protein
MMNQYLLLAYATYKGVIFMPRPCITRNVYEIPRFSCFKPKGIPLSELEKVQLSIDEFEAVRLADLEGLYHEEAAVRMGISRQTFGNIIESARKKIADALANSKALIIEGGQISLVGRDFICSACNHSWTVPCSEQRPEVCPTCGLPNIRPIDIPDDGQQGSRPHKCRRRMRRCGR